MTNSPTRSCTGPDPGTWPRQVPGWQGLPSVPDAARTVIRAYLGAHGPATPEMFDAWLMRKMSRKKELRGWFEALADELTSVDVEGARMHVLPEHLDELVATRPVGTVRLLGGFDQYLLGAGTDATHVVPAERRPEVSRAAGWISPVVLIGGKVAGVWEARDGKVAVTAFEDLPPEPLRAEIARLGSLLF